ncbi:transglutaminase-like domain-containing protein [Litoreibacter janthinus]|nr:transglutaminase family protein [Litoreibacter janthinus]
MRSNCDDLTDLSPTSPLHFLGPSPRLPPNNAIRDFALDLYEPNASVVENVIRIGKALHDAMTFDATATTVDTVASDAFRLRRGVCQDFTHIMILALQSLGIPAGYVSGYLRTLPPPGGVKLEGADAMHAWVRAWCGPEQGWIEYDPTNATLVGTDHVVAGYGRDYSDVSPVRGHLRSSGGQKNSQAVDVAIAG